MKQVVIALAVFIFLLSSPVFADNPNDVLQTIPGAADRVAMDDTPKTSSHQTKKTIKKPIKKTKHSSKKKHKSKKCHCTCK